MNEIILRFTSGSCRNANLQLLFGFAGLWQGIPVGAISFFSLYDGGKEVISIGEHCLIGANAGVGISLGDNNVVEAGCYITAGSKIALPDATLVKARELSGASGLLFRRNSVTGALEAVNREGTWGGLNSVLHAN